MKILIVNGFSKTQKGKEEFTKYLAVIQEVFFSFQDGPLIAYILDFQNPDRFC